MKYLWTEDTIESKESNQGILDALSDLKIKEENTLQFLAGFKRYSTERVMKSLVGK